MGKLKANLNYLKENKLIAEALKENPLNEKKERRYLLALKRIFGEESNFEKKFGDFLKMTSNQKSAHFMKWVAEDVETKVLKYSTRSRDSMKDSTLVTVWTAQGLLGLLGNEYRANHKRMDKQLGSTDDQISISKEDCEKLYDKLDEKYKLILKMMLFTGLNGVDLVKLTLGDFKNTRDANFKFVKKFRSKTKAKGAKFQVIFHKAFYEEIEAFCNANKTKKNEPIFFSEIALGEKDKKGKKKITGYTRSQLNESTISDVFRHKLEKFGLNSKTTPKYIRQLNNTLLAESKIADKLINIWTGHKSSISETHYQKMLPTFIEMYESFAKAVLIGNGFLKSLKEDKTQDKRIVELEKRDQEKTQALTELKNEILELKALIKSQI